MKRVGIALLLAALSASAQMRSSAHQGAPVSMSPAGRGFSQPPARGSVPNWRGGGYAWGGQGWNHGGVRVGNWTFRTVPPQRGCPGFNCVSYPYYPSYYPTYVVPYYPSWGMTTYDPNPVPPSAPVTSSDYIYGDNGASQSSAYNAGYSAAMAQVASQSAGTSRYGDHYLDSRENPQPPPTAQPAVTVINPDTPGKSRSYTSSAPAPLGPATVLVFKDGHTVEIHNYAIIGTTLWNLSEQSARKIPLSELNLDATVKANDDRGVPFKLPGKQD